MLSLDLRNHWGGSDARRTLNGLSPASSICLRMDIPSLKCCCAFQPSGVSIIVPMRTLGASSEGRRPNSATVARLLGISVRQLHAHMAAGALAHLAHV